MIIITYLYIQKLKYNNFIMFLFNKLYLFNKLNNILQRILYYLIIMKLNLNNIL